MAPAVFQISKIPDWGNDFLLSSLVPQYLVDNCLRIHCTIWVEHEGYAIQHKVEKKQDAVDADLQLAVEKEKMNRRNHQIENLKLFYDSVKKDVTIISGTGASRQAFQAHSIILSGKRWCFWASAPKKKIG